MRQAHFRMPVIGFITLTALLFASAGCGNLPSGGSPVDFPPDVDTLTPAIQPDATRTAQTVQTQTSTATLMLVSSTLTARPALEITSVPGPVQATHHAVKPGPSADCDKASAGTPFDLTIPDNTVLEAGESFTKIWRLYNAGTCTWTKEYRVELFSGEPMNGPGVVYLEAEVSPGETLDLSVDLQAPDNPGVFQSNWKLRNASGAWFGIGPNADAPFWVRIEVSLPEEPATAELTQETEQEEDEASLPQAEPTQVIAATGAGSLNLEQAVDLDYFPNGQDEGEDLRYTFDPELQASLQPLGRTRLMVFGPSQPEMQECLEGSLQAETLPLAAVDPDSYLCYRTNLGLPGWMRVSLSSPENPAGPLDFVIFTWSIP